MHLLVRWLARTLRLELELELRRVSEAGVGWAVVVQGEGLSGRRCWQLVGGCSTWLDWFGGPRWETSKRRHSVLGRRRVQGRRGGGLSRWRRWRCGVGGLMAQELC